MKPNYFTCALLWLAATGVSSAQVTLNTVPSRIVGHLPNPAEGLSPTNFNPNLVEGRELYGPSGLALDSSVSPPILYVSDTANNRVLAWKNAAGFMSGAPADLVVGQPDPYTTLPAGPGSVSGFSAGLNAPTGLAVRNGDLYVIDSGNNRVLRFSQPFANVGRQVPNLLIGQPTLSTKTANYPAGKPSANGIFLCCTPSAYTANIAFDSSGNLWFTDAGNRRVLRYPAGAIAANPANFPAADFVLGWTSPTDFVDRPKDLTVDVTGAYTTTQFYVPAGIGFDAAGRLYVTDAEPNLAISRVLAVPITSAINGLPQLNGNIKILGLPPQSSTPPPQAVLNQTLLVNPSAVFFVPDSAGGSDVGVVDTNSSRLLIFPPFERWTDSLVAPPAIQVVGQNGDFGNRNPNNVPTAATFANSCLLFQPGEGLPPSASTLACPGAAVFFNNQLFVADTANNRVITLPFSGGSFGAATGVLGQTLFTKGSINYIDGREFNFTTSGDTGIAIDNTSGTPHLYVSDPGNHRVLGFRDMRTLSAGSKADLVIGQPDFLTGVCNYPSGNPTQPQQNTLCGPIGLAVDTKGNLYVADSVNGRVQRFPQPFNFSGAMEPADLVLGQQDFVSQFTDPTPSNMARPYGVAFSGTNGLVASDTKHNRVLFFPATNGNFTNGETATKVFGQGLFQSITPGNSQASLNQPHHVACDSSGLIYVADTGNSRVQIFGDPNNPGTPLRGASAIFSLIDNFQQPHGVYVSPVTGEIWVTDTNNQGDSYAARRYGRYPDQLTVNGASTAQIPSAAQSLAVAQDQFGDLVLADFSERIAIYFRGLRAVNGGSFLVTKQLAPGMVGSVCAADAGFVAGSNALDCGSGTPTFGAGPVGAANFPLNPVLGDTQVLFNGKATPLYYVSPTQINFVVPNGQNDGDVPTTGSADLQVIRASTGQVLAAGSVQMNSVSPGILQLVYVGQLRQAAVLNQDGTANSPTNQAARGSTIQIFATGSGFIPGAPPDGVPATSPVSTPGTPQVIIGACLVDDSACTMESGGHVKYSGVSAFPGVWQVNVQIPMNTAPGGQVPLFLGMNGIFNSTVRTDGFAMTIAVK